MAKRARLRNVAFEVDVLQAAVDRLAADGYGLVGGIGQYEHIWRMAYGMSGHPPGARAEGADVSEDRFFSADWLRRVITERLRITTPDEIDDGHCDAMSRPKYLPIDSMA
jgi:hypothetical protein